MFYYFTSVAKGLIKIYYQLFHDEGPYHIETSPLSCRVNQWTGFYMIRTSVMKELKRYQSTVLRKRCPYSQLLWSAFSHIWTICRDLLCKYPYSGRMGKRRNSKTLNTNTFSHSTFLKPYTLQQYGTETYLGPCQLSMIVVLSKNS